ncbi:ATP-binding protein [Vibrio sp.]|nr:ATP-binding protein [Vibrio sp.]
MLLKRLKIKSRLVLLSLIPAIVVSVGAYIILKHLAANLSSYKLTENKIELIDETLNLNNRLYRLFADKATNVHWNRQQIQDVRNLVIELENESHNITSYYSGETVSGIDASLKELQLFLTNVGEDQSTSLIESAQLGFALNYEVLVAINKLKIHGASSELFYVNENFEYLSWFLYWVQKEAWLVHAIKLQGMVSDEVRREYVEVISRQQVFWENFVNYAANNDQLSQINTLLSDSAYQKASLLRAKILDGDISPNILDEGARLNVQKVDKLLHLFTGYSNTIAANIQHQRHVATSQIWATRGVVIAVLFILVTVSVTTSYRITEKLSRILETMRGLNSKCDRVGLIEVDGRDEFSEFADNLNAVIVQVREHERSLVIAREEAIQANKAKSAFLANISHEIRTPLNGIIGLTEILTMHELTPSQKEIVTDIEISSQTLLVLINDVLDLSKIESGKLGLSPSQFDVRELVYNTTNLVNSKALSQLNELHVLIDTNVPRYLNADGVRVKQVLMNLLSNAVKFTHEGYVKTHVSYDWDKQLLTCTVSDTGIGIQKDRLESIFEPFHQADSTITRRYGGTGLGLTICKQLIDLMKGKITLESIPNMGSQFAFSLPISAVEDEPYEHLEMKTILIANGSPYVEPILQECELYDIQVERLESIDELKGDKTARTSCILYCTNLVRNTLSDIQAARFIAPSAKVITMQHHLFVSQEVTNNADGNVTLPFLGEKFLTLLKSEFSTAVKYKLPQDHQIENIPAPLGRRILIVEDNLMNQKIAGFFLDRADLEYTIVNNGQEALDIITQGAEYSAILMDCMMPVMDGLTATQKIREWEEQNNKAPVPIIALTASVLDEDVTKCFEAGMNAYLPKPYKSEQLYGIFEKFNIS